MGEHESAHVKALKARQPFSMLVDVTGCYGHTGEALPQLRVKILSKKEDMAAIEAAHVAVAQRAKLYPQLGEAGVQRLVTDADFLNDVKCAECIWRAFRDPDNPAMPAWPSPEWVLENFDADVLGALVNVYEHARQKRGPRPWDISDHWVERIREAVVSSGEDFPESPMAGFSREYLADFVVHAMRCWDRERSALLSQICAAEPMAEIVDSEEKA